MQGHIGGVVDVRSACATLWLPAQIFGFDIRPSASGPVKAVTPGIEVPRSPDL